MAHAGRRTRDRKRWMPWAYVAGGGVLLAAAVAATVVLWTPPPLRSGATPLGSAAPSIALPATTGGTLALSQLRGSKVVLYSYEGAG